jgi:tagatose 1,6-diphosphate aldolase
VTPRTKPDALIRTVHEFSRPEYKVDILKVEFPVVAGTAEWSHREVLEWFRATDHAASVPYIFLSAGIDISSFVNSLELAAEAGAAFSGVLCGRALWQDGAKAFVSGNASFERWLETDGVLNFRRIQTALKAASSWERRRL